MHALLLLRQRKERYLSQMDDENGVVHHKRIGTSSTASLVLERIRQAPFEPLKKVVVARRDASQNC